MVHGLDELKAINREAVAKHAMQRISEANEKHHKACYGREKLLFEWQVPEHPGIWAFGGIHDDVPPVFLAVRWKIPNPDEKAAWWCYLGPVPEFANEGMRHG